MTEMITFLSSNISDPHFFIEVKSKKTCLRHVMQTFSFLFIIPHCFKKVKGILLSPPSVCLSIRSLCYLLLNHWGAYGSKIKFHPAVCPLCCLLLNRWTKFNQIWSVSYSHEWGVQQQKKFLAPPLVTLGEVKGQISLNFGYHVNFKDFYTKLCVCSHK